MKLVFLHSSDTHGFLLPTDYQKKGAYQAPFSLSRVSSLINAEKIKYGAKHVVVTDAGDCLQGSPLAAFTHATNNLADWYAFAAAYNQVGYDARCLGNHDFNFGLDYLTAYIDNNRAPIINDNILDAQTGVPAFGQEYRIIKRSGVKIGLLGVTTPYIPHWEPQKHIAGLKFISAYEQLKHYVSLIRPRVDVLAVLYHGGFECDPVTGKATEPNRGENEGYRILTQIPGIDVFLTGHQHRRMNLVCRHTAIVQPGYRGEAVAEVVLDLDDKTKQIKKMSTRLIDTKSYAPDKRITQLVQGLELKTQVWLDRPLAHLSEPAPIKNAMAGRLKGAPFINLLQQMQLYFTKADVSATAVMSEKAKGFGQEVTMRDVLLNYPYANQLCRVKLTGRQLRCIIEYSLAFLTKDEKGRIKFLDRWLKPKPLLYHFDVFYPVHYEADISRPAGHRLTKLTLHGQNIEPERIYHLAVNNYRAMGGGFYPEYSPDKIEFTLDKDYVQMFTSYLRRKKVKVDTKRNYYFY